MEEFFTMEALEEAVVVIRQKTGLQPRVGLVLGSGLNALADAMTDAVEFPFSDIPHFPVSTVQGHQGRLLLGYLEGVPVAVMQGRAHFYEGYSMARVVLPVRVLKLLGIEKLIVTNAAGGLNLNYVPGEVMIIRDHLNLIGMAGWSPLRGPNLEAFGPRFPSTNDAYTPALRALARQAAMEAGVPYHQGVYICLAGPNFEGPADVRYLRLIGADAVGMSTVPEVIAACHAGVQVLGLSGITNTLSGEEGGPPPNHEEVLEAGKLLVPRLETIIRGVLRALAAG